MFYKYVIKQWFLSFIKKLLFLSVNNVTKYDQFFGFICAGNTKQNISFPLSSRTSPFTRRLICKSQIWSNDKERTCSEQKKCWIVINLCLYINIWCTSMDDKFTRSKVTSSHIKRHILCSYQVYCSFNLHIRQK